MSSHWTSDEFTRSQLACFLNQLTYTANKRHMGLSNGCSSQQTTQVTNILSSTPTVPGMVCLSNEFSHPKWWSKRNTRRHLGKWRMWNWWWYRVLYIYIYINITHKMFSYIYIYTYWLLKCMCFYRYLMSVQLIWILSFVQSLVIIFSFNVYMFWGNLLSSYLRVVQDG